MAGQSRRRFCGSARKGMVITMNEQERRKVISIMIPCYNEEENARQIYQAVKNELETSLPQYDYEILFIDNKSKDHTREIIRDICAHDQKVRAIFNCRNFGQFNSPYYGILNTSGDCTITICADFQDPVEMIPKFVHDSFIGDRYHPGCLTKRRSLVDLISTATKGLNTPHKHTLT